MSPGTLVSLLQAKQLERKERELATISAFYKEQLETLEKKVRMIRFSPVFRRSSPHKGVLVKRLAGHEI